MMSLFRAEWQKTVGNRWLTGFLVWVFPVGALAIMVLWIVAALFNDNIRYLENAGGEWTWTADMITAWGFPSNLLGRLLLMGLTAVIFAGEYQWGTWKNIVPQRPRWQLILIKFFTVCVLIFVAFNLTALFWAGGRAIVAWLGERPYGPALSGAVLRDFLGDYALAAGLAFTAVIITAVFAALAAIITRSILGALVVGLVISIVEPVILVGLFLTANILEQPGWLHLYRLTVGYNIANVQSWIVLDEPTPVLKFVMEQLGGTAPVDGVAFSLGVLAVWLVLGLTLVVYLFQRQDISS